MLCYFYFLWILNKFFYAQFFAFASSDTLEYPIYVLCVPLHYILRLKKDFGTYNPVIHVTVRTIRIPSCVCSGTQYKYIIKFHGADTAGSFKGLLSCSYTCMLHIDIKLFEMLNDRDHNLCNVEESSTLKPKYSDNTIAVIDKRKSRIL